MTPPAAAATGRTLPRTAAPRTPRRVSGPAPKNRRGEDATRRTPPARPGTARSRGEAAPRDPFIIRAIERTMKMADSRFLDRLIRGRLWIPLVAAGLMGIVFMQVSMLKLNAGIGRAVQSAQTLERQNSLMRAQVSGMESGAKIDETAKSLGMVAPAASTTPSFVTAGGGDQARAAAKHMTAADPEAVARTRTVEGATTGAAATTTTGVATTTTTTTTGAATTTATGVATTGTATTATTTGAATTTGTTPAGAGTTAAGATTAGGTTPATGTTGAGATPAGAATTGAATTGATTTGASATGVAQTPQTQTQTATATPTSTSGGAVAPAAQ